MSEHMFVLIREDGLDRIDALVSLVLKVDARIENSSQAWKAFTRAVAKWADFTVRGRACVRDARGYVNIGDLLNHDAFGHISFRIFLRRFGIVEAKADSLVEGNRRDFDEDLYRGDWCPRCSVQLEPGQALVSTLTGEEDEIGGCVTLSPGGPGQMVDVSKCPQCGFSRTTPPKS